MTSPLFAVHFKSRTRFSIRLWPKYHIMSSLHERLKALNQRLENITQLPTNQEISIEADDLDFDSTKLKYICAECAWTTSSNALALSRHFILRHPPRFECPDCKFSCDNQVKLKEHRSRKHGHLCPACQRIFATVKECSHHEPCEGRYNIALKARGDASPLTPTDQSLAERVPVSAPSLLDGRGSILSGSCPDPGCHLTFLTFDTLYEHYVSSHPLCLLYNGHSKPFKCPFCPKRYQHERFVAGHIRTHKPKPLGNLGIGETEDQEALIRQSRVAMAKRESQLSPTSQARANSASSDEEEGYLAPIEPQEDYSLALEDGIVYMIYPENGVKSEFPNLEQSDQTYMQASLPFEKMTPIGLVLQACSKNLSGSCFTTEGVSVTLAPLTRSAEPKVSDSMDLNDDYPERFALDVDELPSGKTDLHSIVISTDTLDGLIHQSLSGEIIRALQMQHFVSVSEVVELFTYLLDKYQRLYVQKQLGEISLNQHDINILGALHNTVFKDLIDAWVDFKRLAIRFAPQLIQQANSQRVGLGKSVTWALLQYCLNLENIIYGNEINIAHHFLRDLPTDDFVVTIDAPFPRLVAALAERVRNRTVHDPTSMFTNEMILRGTKDYVTILHMIFRPLYPVGAGHEGLWRELRLF